jgi:hypothetical protein
MSRYQWIKLKGSNNWLVALVYYTEKPGPEIGDIISRPDNLYTCGRESNYTRDDISVWGPIIKEPV